VKIGIDISVLYIAGAGVFYYRYNLIKALLALSSPHDYVLLDYSPVEGDWVRNDPSELRLLLQRPVEVRRVRGLKHRKLARVGLVQRRGMVSLANRVDTLLDGSWRRLIRAERERRLRNHLSDVQVFHSSDVLNWAVPGARNVTTIHDLTALLYPEYHTQRVRDALASKFRFAREEAQAVIAVSESAKRDAVEHLGLDPARVFVVHNGVDAGFRPLPRTKAAHDLRRFGLTPGEYLLYLGTIEPRKNLVRLVQAYKRLRQSAGPVPRLVLAGAKGWMVDEVELEVSKLNLESEVCFLGRVDGAYLTALYNGAVCFLYPSLYEGFGLPVLEAMACGTPTLTSRSSSLPEVAGDAAVLVDPMDVKAMAEGMEVLLLDRDRAAVLRQRGLERARRFTWEETARKTLRVYEGGRVDD
jgi:glycosyltransferase involved in cell wall biosynthesis